MHEAVSAVVEEYEVPLVVVDVVVTLHEHGIQMGHCLSESLASQCTECPLPNQHPPPLSPPTLHHSRG